MYYLAQAETNQTINTTIPYTVKDDKQQSSNFILPIMAIVVVVLLIIIVLIWTRKRRNKAIVPVAQTGGVQGSTVTSPNVSPRPPESQPQVPPTTIPPSA